MNSIIPTIPEILREAIIIAAGALLAAIVIRQLPPAVQAMFYLPGQGKTQ